MSAIYGVVRDDDGERTQFTINRWIASQTRTMPVRTIRAPVGSSHSNTSGRFRKIARAMATPLLLTAGELGGK